MNATCQTRKPKPRPPMDHALPRLNVVASERIRRSMRMAPIQHNNAVIVSAAMMIR
jgi:hypothetical protein